MSLYDQGLDRQAANFTALSPVSFVERSAEVYAELPAVIHGARRYSWARLRDRSARLAAALRALGVVRGGEMVVLEGPVAPGRRVLLEFPDLAAVRAFHADPAYAPLIALRQRAARGTLIAIDGLPPGGA